MQTYDLMVIQDREKQSKRKLSRLIDCSQQIFDIFACKWLKIKDENGLSIIKSYLKFSSEQLA